MRFFKKKKNQSYFLDPDEILADSYGAVDSSYAPEGKLEKPIGKIAHAAFLGVVMLGIGYLGAQAAVLQVRKGEDFFSRAQGNRFVTRPILAPRGIIYDRHENILVENYPSFGLLFSKNDFLKDGGTLEELLPVLADTLGKPPEFFYEIGFPPDMSASSLPLRIVIAQGIGPEEIVGIASRLNVLPGISIFENFRRAYSDSFAFSHLLGYAGKVSQNDLASRPGLRFEDTIGKTGAELVYDDLLRGEAGRKILEVDASGRETRFKLIKEPEAGHDLFLTIDGELQKKIYQIVSDFTGGKRGASVVALDPDNGAVLALVSHPGFNGNKFGFSLSVKEYELILKDPLKPLFNRSIAGEFPSGSVLKPLLGAAALEEKLIDPKKKIYAPRYLEIPNPYNPNQPSRFADWKEHGWVDFYDAIAYSSNFYFYMLGGGFREQPGLGIERIKKYASLFGFGSKLGIDLPGEKTGLIPDPEWKRNADSVNPAWRIGDTYNTSIGQGAVKVTPLQMAAFTAALANGGILYRPRVMDYAKDKEGKVILRSEPEILRRDTVSQGSLNEVLKGMRQAVTGGTARLLNTLPVTSGAKTGTAQAGPGNPHAWVTVYAPVENPKIALVVMVEHAGEGSAVAVPISREILQWYFSKE